RKALDLLGLTRDQKARVLLMHDPTDREVPFEDARALAGAWPGASLLPVSRAGHTRALRHLEVIQRAVAFVSEPPRLVALSGPTLAFVARRKSAGARRSLGAADARGHGDDLEQLGALVGEGRKRFARAEHSAHEGGSTSRRNSGYRTRTPVCSA